MVGLGSVLGASATFAAAARLAFPNIVYVGGDDTGRLVTLWPDSGVAQAVIDARAGASSSLASARAGCVPGATS